MPKIVINEYDLTKAGTGEYENFSVVVPGFVGDNCDESVFDENSPRNGEKKILAPTVIFVKDGKVCYNSHCSLKERRKEKWTI